MEEGRSQPFTAGPGPSAAPVTAAMPSQSAAPPPPAAPGAQPEAIPSYFLNNPAMLLAAQQMAAQKLLQQQLQIKANGQALSAGLALQPSPASAPAEAPLPVSNGAHTSAALERRAPEEPTEKPLERVDPGGRIVWAKLGAYPWWPAKVLTRGRDLSFPPLEEPPRPNAIPVRFFGTYDFSWLGSKRAVMDWAEVRLGWPWGEYSGCGLGAGRSAVDGLRSASRPGMLKRPNPLPSRARSSAWQNATRNPFWNRWPRWITTSRQVCVGSGALGVQLVNVDDGTLFFNLQPFFLEPHTQACCLTSSTRLPSTSRGAKSLGSAARPARAMVRGTKSGSGVGGRGHLACAGGLLTVQWHAMAVNLPLADDLAAGKHSDGLADGGVQTPVQTPEERRKAVLARRRQYLQVGAW